MDGGGGGGGGVSEIPGIGSKISGVREIRKKSSGMREFEKKYSGIRDFVTGKFHKMIPESRDFSHFLPESGIFVSSGSEKLRKIILGSGI